MRGTDLSRGLLVALVTCSILGVAACTARPAAAPVSAQPPATKISPPATSADPRETAIPQVGPVDEDTFWAMVGGDAHVETFDSLKQIIASSDLIVVGEVVEFREGRRILIPETGDTMLMGEIRIKSAEVLRGRVESPPDSPGIVVVEAIAGFSTDPSPFAVLDASTPVGRRVVVLLLNKADDAVRRGFPPDAPYAGKNYYALLNGIQAVVRDDAGSAAVGYRAHEWAWLEGLKGRPFDDVLETIRAEVSGAS